SPSIPLNSRARHTLRRNSWRSSNSRRRSRLNRRLNRTRARLMLSTTGVGSNLLMVELTEPMYHPMIGSDPQNEAALLPYLICLGQATTSGVYPPLDGWKVVTAAR